MSQLSSAVTPDSLQSIQTASANLNAGADRELAYAQLQAQKEQAEAELRARFALQEGQIAAEAEQQKAQAELAKELQSGENQRYREYQDFQSRERTAGQEFQAGQAQREQDFEAQQREQDRQHEQTMFDTHQQALLEERLAAVQGLQVEQEGQDALNKQTLALEKRRSDIEAQLSAAQLIYGKSENELQQMLTNFRATKDSMLPAKKAIEDGARRAAEVGVGNAVFRSVASQPGSVYGQIAQNLGATKTPLTDPQSFVKAITERSGEELGSQNPGAVSDLMAKFLSSLQTRASAGADGRTDAIVQQDFDALVRAGVDPAAITIYVQSLADFAKSAVTEQRLKQLAKQANPEAEGEVQFKAEDSAALGNAFGGLSRAWQAYKAVGLNQKATTAADMEKVFGLLERYTQTGGGNREVEAGLAADKETSAAADKFGMEQFTQYVPTSASGSVGQMQIDKKAAGETVAALKQQLADVLREKELMSATGGGEEAHKVLDQQAKSLEARIKAIKGRKK